MTPSEIYEDMLTRCWEVDTLDRAVDGGASADAGVGHMIMSQTGHILALEVGIDGAGRAFASMRVFDSGGSLVEPAVFHVDGSVMAVTP